MDSSQAQQAAAEIQSSFEAWLIDLLNDFKYEALKHFQQQAQQESSPEIREDFLKAIDLIESRHEQATNTLRQNIQQGFSTQKQDRKPLSVQELSLVDEIEVERFVRRANLANYLIKNHKIEIKSAEARLYRLRKNGADIYPKAISPDKFFEKMKLALDVYEMPISARNAYVDLFEIQCISKLVEGYRLINQIAEEHGLERSMEVQRTDPRKPADQYDEKQLQKQLIAHLMQLNENIGSTQKTQLFDGDAQANLQQLLLRKSTGANTEPELQSLDTQAIDNPAIARQIDFVEKILTAISQDEQLDARVRTLISELFLPLSILSIKDRNLFANSNHPGRILVRELSLFGNCSTDIIDRRIEEVESLVRHIILDNARDLKVISQAAESIWNICDQELQNFISDSIHNNKKRVQEMRMREARRRVAMELREQLLGRQLPRELKPILQQMLGPWMIIRYLRYGHNSKPWLESLAYMRLSIDAIQPVKDRDILQRRIATRRHLITRLKARVARSKLANTQIQPMINKLEDYFKKLSLADQQRLEQEQTAEDHSTTLSEISITESDLAEVPYNEIIRQPPTINH
ncbi:MAG: DUF1631 family protein [Oleiphilaceae bacterium]|nr:DUF1631 family protein [Oleiphilaceae bacterium]